MQHSSTTCTFSELGSVGYKPLQQPNTTRLRASGARAGRRGLRPRLLAAVIRSNAIMAFAAERQVVSPTKGASMLQLRPSCENCNEPLPPESLKARICSFECTFCMRCVEEVLWNVCPNCGGGFCPRPVRPSRNWKGDNYLGAKPAS